MSNAPAGWYPQPDGSRRYWDGGQWSASVAPGGGGDVAPVLRGEVVPANPPRMSAAAYTAPQYAAPAQVAAKSPGLALLASFFLPGLGQFVNGEAAKGIAFLVAYFASILLMFVLVGFVTIFVVWIWGMVDAYTGAQRWNARHGIVS